MVWPWEPQLIPSGAFPLELMTLGDAASLFWRFLADIRVRNVRAASAGLTYVDSHGDTNLVYEIAADVEVPERLDGRTVLCEVQEACPHTGVIRTWVGRLVGLQATRLDERSPEDADVKDARLWQPLRGARIVEIGPGRTCSWVGVGFAGDAIVESLGTSTRVSAQLHGVRFYDS
jgi:hypothetical protein